MPNKSDLVALVRVMARDAKSLPSTSTRAFVASDGWFVSMGMDTESGSLPRGDAFAAAVTADGGIPDLSIFASATWCGLHGLGSTNKKTVERDRLWVDLFAAGNGPVLATHPTCEGLFPPVSPKLVRDSSGADTLLGAGDSP